MNRGIVVLTLLAVLLADAVLTVPSTAQAESACDPGFALTGGGIPEADLNGDGLTCEVSSVDLATGDLTTLALDNAPADPMTTNMGCPPPESGFFPAPYPDGLPISIHSPSPDRNGDFVVCVKGGKMTSKHIVIIDNNVPCDPTK